MVFSAGIVIGSQPHMENALNSLQSAKNELLLAKGAKGGHKVQAIKLIDRAITEVQAGIYADGR
jgi:hypothetical protein